MSDLPDVLAYLRRRHGNALLVAKTMKGRDFGEVEAGFLEDRRRQLEVIIGELQAGFHEGEAAVAAELAARQLEGNEDGASSE